MKPAKDTKLCRGCRDDFYNGRRNCDGGNTCWSFPRAKVVRRWRLDWWTAPVDPQAFTECWVLSCYHQPGSNAFYERLPAHAVEPVRLPK